MTILYFSATGNNLYVAKQLGDEVYSIPKAIKEQKLSFADDKIGIVFPIYGLTVPDYIEDFLEQVELKSDYIFAIMTYGMFAGAAVTHLQRIAERNKIDFAYINKIIMVDNYLPGFDMEKQIAGESKKAIDKQIQQIKAAIDSSTKMILSDSMISRMVSGLAKKMRFPRRDKELGVYQNSFDTAFRVEADCTSCGVCSQVCPLNNIVLDNKPKFNGNCMGCLACTHNCPQNVIRVKKEKNKKRFRNQHVSLKEIIDSNN